MGFWIPWAVLRIPKPRNPDSTSKHSQIPDSTKFESDHNVKLLPLLQLETSHIRFPLKQELWRKIMIIFRGVAAIVWVIGSAVCYKAGPGSLKDG